MNIYDQLLNLPISERTAAYGKLTETERQYCNARAALACQKNNLQIYNETGNTYSKGGNRYFDAKLYSEIKGKILLLEKEVKRLELQLPTTQLSA